MNLHEKLISMRKESRLTQEDLAEKLNVSRQAISRWETGAVIPDSKNIIALSNIFNVSADYLLNNDYNSDNFKEIKSINKDNKVLQTNKTLIAIILQSSFLYALVNPYKITEFEILNNIIVTIKLLLLLFTFGVRRFDLSTY